MIIGIVHHRSNKKFLYNLLESIKGVKYPVYIVINEVSNFDHSFPYKVILNPDGGYELGALKKLLQETDDEDIFLIQDSHEIKDLSLFDLAASLPGSLATAKGFYHYTGKYKRSILEKVGIPDTKSKQDAINAEYDWHRVYCKHDPQIVMLENPLIDDMPNMRYEEKFGRLNMVLENDYVKKYKGNWGQI